MAVGLLPPEKIEPVEGIELASIEAGIYKRPRPDLALIKLSSESSVAAVFTQNRYRAAPVQIALKHLSEVAPKYLLINAGNANAGTGEKGLYNAELSCSYLAEIVNCAKNEIIPFSTGVIGEPLPIDRFKIALPNLVKQLSREKWLEVAKSIMTTDTVAKAFSEKIELGDEKISITGIAKGSGMINPQMATMLAFVATDASIETPQLNKMLKTAVDMSFNRITVDGDTSTNDACVLIATCKKKHEVITDESHDYEIIQNAINRVFMKLAHAIVRDGEGASKFIEIEVVNGASTDECLRIGRSIANSPLVKTAFNASDPNWGRILAAVGNARDTCFDINKVNIYLDDVCIVEAGQRSSTYTESAGKAVMIKEEIKIKVDLTSGKANDTVWTSDLSHEYVSINADYRT